MSDDPYRVVGEQVELPEGGADLPPEAILALTVPAELMERWKAGGN